MRREEQIENLKFFYTPDAIESDEEIDISFDGFRREVRWADSHPINVWHNVSEKPELNQYFLAQIGNDTFDTFIMFMDENKDWRKWSEGMNIKMWAHIKDLLPKGGKK